MTRTQFRRLVAEELDRIPDEFRERIENVAVLVEDAPPRDPARAPAPRSTRPGTLLLGLFVGTPTTQKSFFDVLSAPAKIILYQKNIEAVCRTGAEIRRQVRLTVIHEIGHYFGMSEDQLRDV